MRILSSVIISLTLCVLSLAFTPYRETDTYVDVHDIDTPLRQLPPQDPAIHSFPTVPTVPLVPTCVKEGYMRDPFNCKKFYYCKNVNAMPGAFYCQSELIFNTVTNECDDPRYVEC